MIYLICGKNTYLSKKKKQELIEDYKKKGFTSEFLDKDYADVRQFLEEFRSQSLFGEKKFFVINSLWERKPLKEKFQKEIKKLQNQEIIIFENKEISSEDKLLKEIQKTGKVFQFSLSDKTEMKKIIKNDLKEENFTIDDIALDTLVEFLSSSPDRFAAELSKLKTYKFFEKKIDTQDVLKLVKPEIDLDVFRMVEAIAKRHKKTALNLINQHLQRGDSPLYLLAMINYQFRNLIIYQEGKNSPHFIDESGMSFFQIKKIQELSCFFDLKKLKQIYQKLFKIDLAVKTGKMDLLEALELLVLET